MRFSIPWHLFKSVSLQILSYNHRHDHLDSLTCLIYILIFVLCVITDMSRDHIVLCYELCSMAASRAVHKVKKLFALSKLH